MNSFVAWDSPVTIGRTLIVTALRIRSDRSFPLGLATGNVARVKAGRILEQICRVSIGQYQELATMIGMTMRLFHDA